MPSFAAVYLFGDDRGREEDNREMVRHEGLILSTRLSTIPAGLQHIQT